MGTFGLWSIGQHGWWSLLLDNDSYCSIDIQDSCYRPYQHQNR